MTTKIDLKKFQKGDNVVITILNNGKEEILPGKITNISLAKNILYFEDNESEYECKFSEIKSITRTKKIHSYGRWIMLYIILLILAIIFDYYFSFPKPNEYVICSFLSVLIFLDIWQYFRVKMDKLNIYEKQNNIPYVLSIPTCVLICPGLVTLTLSLASLGLHILPPLVIIILLLSFSLGPVLFIKDQVELYRHKKNYQCFKKFWIRMIEFFIFYPLCAYIGYGLTMVFVAG